MKVSYLLTGNELMSGDTVDTNSSMISQALKDLGLVPWTKRIVGDDLPLLVSSIRELAALSDVLIVNGGLGPTRDDLTATALSEASARPLTKNKDAVQHLQSWAEQRGFVITESNLKQAFLPDTAEIIDNPVGSAVGFSLSLNNCLVICTPGVPSELKPMVFKHLLPMIREHGGLFESSQITRLRVFGVTESGLQDAVNRAFPDWPEEVDLGFRVQMPVIEVKLRTIGEHRAELNKQWTQRFSDLFSDYIIGRDNTRLSEALNLVLRERGLRLSTAESCTGGGIAAGITSEAGSSDVFEAGFVTYSNRMKQSVLGVKAATLSEHGAVSEATVLEMAAGALNASKSDLAIAISGIAGPGGGSPDKPVGTVWMAWGRTDKLKARRFFLPMSRLAFQRTATAIAMDLVRREVMGLSTDIDYFSELKRKQNRVAGH